MHSVAIAVSGGIDSLVAAWLLKNAGHRPTGLFFTTGFEAPDPPPERVADALSRQLDIPVHVVTLEKAFQKHVISYFLAAYGQGRTPNPCVVCNRAIKFGSLLGAAMEMGLEKLATGHYARVETDAHGRFLLKKGRDPVKDQSYFLSMLNQRQLERAIFPLGAMLKTDVQALSRNAGLRPVVVKESQDICFVKNGSYADFFLETTGRAFCSGPVENTMGQVIGTHDGLHRYTIGQRKGIGIPGPEPYYVVRMDPEKRRLVVGAKADLLSCGCRLEAMNWILPPPEGAARVEVRVRYRHLAAHATLIPEGPDRARICFDQPQSAVTPGQVGVIYAGQTVWGAGWITPAPSEASNA